MANNKSSLFAGISNASIQIDEYDLTNGVFLRKTYAHFMSPQMMAFKEANPGKHHPAPWVAVNGGSSFDILIELEISSAENLPGNLSQKETIWWIAALLRLAYYPYLVVPAISNISFASAPTSVIPPNIEPFETNPRIFSAENKQQAVISEEKLSWIKDVWVSGAGLIASNEKLRTAIEALDFSTVHGRTSSSLLAVWGGLEQLFSPSSSELRFRVSANIAAFLEKPGEKRLELFKKLYELYNHRSQAAHTAKAIEHSYLIESFVVLRNVIVKILDEQFIPNKEWFERELFSPTDNN